jgi:hypothetical protein
VDRGNSAEQGGDNLHMCEDLTPAVAFACAECCMAGYCFWSVVVECGNVATRGKKEGTPSVGKVDALLSLFLSLQDGCT